MIIMFRAWDNRYKGYVKDVLIENSGKIYFDDGVATQDDLDIRIEQFTGMKDMNGKDIYIGDIIHFGSAWCVGDEYDPREEEHIGAVEYRQDYASYVVNCNGKIFPLEQVISFDGYLVQGNVHENPGVTGGGQMKFYCKQPIEAEQFDGSTEMIERYDMGFQLASNGKDGEIIKTLEGDLLVHEGDWIATGIKGEHWPIADDVFKQTYAELPVIPKYVAECINYMKSSHRDIWDTINYPFRSDNINKYMEDNSETFARAWLDGYQVEEDK